MSPDRYLDTGRQRFSASGVRGDGAKDDSPEIGASPSVDDIKNNAVDPLSPTVEVAQRQISQPTEPVIQRPIQVGAQIDGQETRLAGARRQWIRTPLNRFQPITEFRRILGPF